MSLKAGKNKILTTAHGACLGVMSGQDIVLLDTKGKKKTKKEPTIENPLHRAIHLNFAHSAVIHTHPIFTNGYFAVRDKLEYISFESRFTLGEVPVLPQETPAITDVDAVVKALKNSNIVVIRNHGVVAIGKTLWDALFITQSLEEAIKMLSVAKLWFSSSETEPKSAPCGLWGYVNENPPSPPFEKGGKGGFVEMFSKEHIQAIVDLVNKDEFIAKKGAELDLTVKLAIKLDETGQTYKFNFEKGKIVRLDFDADAPFVISASGVIWEEVFLGKLDSFVAVTQGKMQLKGQLGQLSKWYVPFSRLFELFKQVRIK